MTIEDRVRQVLADAVADEPPPRGAPLERALRRRRSRPALVGAAALVLVLAAVVGLVAVRDRQRPLPATAPTQGWKTDTVDADNFRFRYPLDWQVEARFQGLRQPDLLVLIPPEQDRLPERRRTVNVNLQAGVGFGIGEDWFGTVRQGRLPGGQAWLRTEGAAIFGGGPEEPATDGPGRYATWTVDWGRPCLTDAPRCATRHVEVSSPWPTNGSGTATPRPSRSW